MESKSPRSVAHEQWPLMQKPVALIIEDDEMLAVFFTASFEDAGYEVKTVHTGAHAFAYLEKNVPDIIMFDLKLPDINGEGILSYIKSQSHFSTTKLFATSMEGLRVSYLQDSVDMVLYKPVSYTQLVKLAERMKS